MTARTGLTAAEVAERRARGLDNAVSTRTGRSMTRIMSSHVFTVFNGVVGGCFVALLALGSWQDALFGFFVIANTVIGAAQEIRANRTLARLAVVQEPRSTVRRDGVDVECPVDEVVVDDLLVLTAGAVLSADGEVVESDDVEVDESLLTGESVPVSASTGRELMSGSIVVAGRGLARVIRVGSDSYAARLAAEARQYAPVASELDASIGRVVLWISIMLVPLGAVVANGQVQAVGGWAAALSNDAWRGAAIAAIASIVAMVPAGLVFMTSVALAVGAADLARRRVLVHELGAVEGLARVDALCIDKTGTLTDGLPRVHNVDVVDPHAGRWSTALAAIAAIPGANATALAIGEAVPRVASDDAPDATVPFSSRHKWSAVHFADGPLGSWVLGGADVVFTEASGAAHGSIIQSAVTAGFRVLVLAHSPHSIPAASAELLPVLPDGLRPVAVITIAERIRPDAATTLGYFADQGVRVFVLSGDDPRTVAAIAHEAGLPRSLRGVDARTLPPDPTELSDVMRTERIFGRVTPEQKKAMVLALKGAGYTVAMTGDGINDALAVKHADLGVAMGSGAPATRAVADVVLLDGSFETLPGIVAQGRKAIANVERLAMLFLSKTVYAVVLAVMFGVLLWPFPYLPRQLAAVDGLTIGLPALVLAVLPNPRVYRPGFLTRVARFCVPAGIVVAGAVVTVVAAARASGAVADDVRTLAVLTVALSAFGVLAQLVRPYTAPTAAVVAASAVGIALLFELPAVTGFLQLTSPPTPLVVVVVGVSVAAGGLVALVRRRVRD